MGIQFNGTNTRVDFENEAFFDWDWGQAFSVACWMYVEPGAIEAGGAFVVGKAGPPGWALDMNLPAGENPTFSLHLISSVGNEIWKYGPDQAWPRGVWAHLAATYDGSSTLAGIKLYLNGLLVGGGGGTDVDSAGGSLLNNNPLSVGGTGSGSEWCDVAVSNAILEKRVWTPIEILALANIANFNRDAKELLSEPPDWHARLASTTDLLDSSGNSNDGSLVGSPTNLADPKVVYVGGRGAASLPETPQTSLTFTTTADIQAGSHVVLSDVHYNQHGDIVNVRVGDLQLELDKRQVLGTLPVNIEFWSARARSRIPAGSTVTVQYALSASATAIVALSELGGVMSGGELDQTTGTFDQSGTATTFDTGTSGATALADEIALSLFGFGTSLTSPLVTVESGWVELLETLSVNLHLVLALKVLTATGTQRHQPTSSEAQSYAGALVTYKAGPLEPPPDLAYSRLPKKAMVGAP